MHNAISWQLSQHHLHKSGRHAFKLGKLQLYQKINTILVNTITFGNEYKIHLYQMVHMPPNNSNQQLPSVKIKAVLLCLWKVWKTLQIIKASIIFITNYNWLKLSLSFSLWHTAERLLYRSQPNQFSSAGWAMNNHRAQTAFWQWTGMQCSMWSRPRYPTGETMHHDVDERELAVL